MKQTKPFTTFSHRYLTWALSFTTTCEVGWSLILFSRPGDPREREAAPTGFSNWKLEDLDVRVTWLMVPWRLLLPEKPFNWQTFRSHPPNQQRGSRVFTGRFASGKFFPSFVFFFFFFFFFPSCTTHGILVPQPGTEPLALGVKQVLSAGPPPGYSLLTISVFT